MTQSTEPMTQRDPWSWVWRGQRSTNAHLIPAHRVTSANPHTLCGRRLRKPMQAWSGVCPKCALESMALSDPHEDYPVTEKR